jgi:hypothetical protein
MAESRGGSLRAAVAWLIFPVVPAILATAYHGIATIGGADLGGTDPRLWAGRTWALALGPLIGYGVLAGATLALPDDPERRGVRSWPMRRAVWVAVGPWSAALIWAAFGFGLDRANRWKDRVLPPSWAMALTITPDDGWFWVALRWIVVATAAYGWLFVAWLALRRARRRGRLLPALARGCITALGFVGSLIGGFWAATEIWRDYFFDSRLARVLRVAAVGLTVAGLSGCGTPTVGDVRRRDLFSAMLTAWVLGLALLWRWWSRRK